MVIVIFTRLRRAFGGFVLILAASILLGGCDSGNALFGDAIELQIKASGSLAVAVCEDLHIDFASGDIHHANGGKWSRFWEAKGNVNVSLGTVGDLDDHPFGLMESTYDAPAIKKRDSVSIGLNDNAGNSASIVTFEIESPAAVTDKWISSNGSISDAPCSGYSPSPE